jgi:purine nucleosidase
MASAILLDPSIVNREVVVIWIGGVGYGGVETYPGVEFNLRNDIAAANVVYDSDRRCADLDRLHHPAAGSSVV